MSEKLTALETAELDLADAQFAHNDAITSLEACDTLMPPAEGGYAVDQPFTVAEAAEILHEKGRIDPEKRDMKQVRIDLVNKETEAAADVGEAREELNRIKSEAHDRASKWIRQEIDYLNTYSRLVESTRRIRIQALEDVLKELEDK